MRPFSFSSLRYSAAEVSRAAHPDELDPPVSRNALSSSTDQTLLQDDIAAGAQGRVAVRDPAKPVHLNIDAFMMGVGGDDSWSPRVHDEYLIGADGAAEHTYSFGLLFTFPLLVVP